MHSGGQADQGGVAARTLDAGDGVVQLVGEEATHAHVKPPQAAIHAAR